MKRLAYQPALSTAALALILASCASSPIKQLVCENKDGEVLSEIIFDPKEKVVYEYDEFSESLKPIDSLPTYLVGLSDNEWEVAFTDSGKIKEKTVINGGNQPYGLIDIVYLTEFDLRTLTYEEEKIETKSKLKDIEDAESDAAYKAAIAHNLEVVNAGSVVDKTTTKTIGTCRYVAPNATNVFDG